MVFINKYNQYKKQYNIICEGTIKSVYPALQKDILENTFQNKSYNTLTDYEKNRFQKYFDSDIKDIIDEVNYITENKQYQSWLYNMIAKDFDKFGWCAFKGDDINDDNRFLPDKMKQDFKKFERIIKSPLFDRKYKNILYFKSYHEFEYFIRYWIQEHPIYQNGKFKKIYSNEKYDIYAIYFKNKQQFQDMYGDKGYHLAWCVADENSSYFERYLKNDQDCYYLWTDKGTTNPFALLHFNSNQFKDIHNHKIEIHQYTDDIQQSILDGLVNCCPYDFINTKLSSDITNDDLFDMYMMLILKKSSNLTPVDIFLKVFPDCGIKNDDGTLDITKVPPNDGLNFFIHNGKLTIKIKDSVSISITNETLNTLEGVPEYVSGTFACMDNKLTDLQFSPKIIEGDYMIINCKYLKSLKGISEEISTELNISNCPSLKSIDYIPSKVKAITIVDCPQLTDVKLLHKFRDSAIIYIDNIGSNETETNYQIKTGRSLFDEEYLD